MKALAERARVGERLDDCFIVDAHTHVGPWPEFPIPRTDHKSMLEAMDRVGVDIAVVTGMVAMTAEFAMGNDSALEAAREHPERPLSYSPSKATYNPSVVS